jgi:thioredoxin 1
MKPGTHYAVSDLQRENADSLSGLALLQFGTNWCGYCQSAQALIEPAMASRPDVARYWIEDGPGRPLGRSYRVKQWPTLVLLRDGQEVGRLVRPQDVTQLFDLLKAASAD